MTLTRGFALSVTLVLSWALADYVGSAAETPAATSGVRLTAINAQVNSTGTSLIIEATEPVPYVATRKDPLTLVLDFRNVGADAIAPSVKPSATSPIASVAVEPTEILGARVTRVTVGLAQPVAHRVRSDRRNVVVDFDRQSDRGTPMAPPVAPGSRTPDALQALESASVSPRALLAGSTSQRVGSQSAAVLRQLTESKNGTAAQSVGATRAAQAPATSTPSVPQSGQESRYVGHPVSMQFEGLDLRAVLRLFAEISGLNIVIDPTVQYTLSLHDALPI